MNKTVPHALAAVLCLAFSASAFSMTSDELKSAKAAIAADYKSARAACAPMSGSAMDVCMAEARKKRNAARAELRERAAPANTVSKAPESKKEQAQDYVDDSVVTARVKTAIFEEPSLKSAEINVETNKGTVQLGGFVRSRANIDRAVQVTKGVHGVKSVKNVMIVKGQQ